MFRKSTQQKIDKAAAAWWVKRNSPGAGADDTAFQAWLQADPRHHQAYDRIEAVSGQLGRMPDAVVQGLVRNLPASNTTRQSTVWHGFLARHWLHFTGSVTVAFVIFFATQAYLRSPVYAQNFSTAQGELQTQDLPDHTAITLDTNTQIEVSYYRDRREVVLHSGQALFSVTKDDNKPFHVKAGKTEVTVVGTRFSVRYLSGSVSVAVREGKVRVASSGNGSSATTLSPYFLTVGQGLTINDHGNTSGIHRVASHDVGAWTEGRLVFDNTALKDAVAEFARYGRTNLVVHDARVANYRITGSFEVRQLDSFAKALPSVLPVQLRHNGSDIEIAARP